MFTFIKKLFGFDQATMKEAGVQIEQAPYKIPEPAAITPIPMVVESVQESIIVNEQNTNPVTHPTTKKQRGPKPKNTVAKKAAPVKKAAAIKAAPKKPRSKKS
jgi:hypothetical protein